LALAVIACRNLLKADAHHIQRSDIAIQFVAPHTEQGHFLADDKFFELVWFANENVSSLFSSCEQFMNKQGYVKAAA
jgi:hypothetical protein